jgi:predicted dehydrogenase
MAGLPPAAADATRIPAGHPEGFIEAFAQLYRDFAADIRRHPCGEAGAQTDVPGLAEGLRSLAFIDAVLRSHAHSGAWTVL